MQLAIALSEGTKWLGFQCKKSKVLYVNLEIDRASFIHRFTEIYEALRLKPKHSHDISIWNLRGIAMPLDKLAPILIRRVASRGYDAIITDPIYFVIDDESTLTKQLRKGEFVDFFIPKKSNKRFAGWFDNEDLKGVKITYYMVYDTDKKFYAKWD
jgi:RecA-family ATPase